MQDHEYLDIVNTTTKTGRILAHIRTEYITPDQQLIGHSTHIKYLPTGNFFMDTFVQYYPPWQSPWLVQRLLSSTLSVPATTERPEFPAGIKAAHENIQDSLNVSNDGHAEFTMTHEHTNALGALHGGLAIFSIPAKSMSRMTVWQSTHSAAIGVYHFSKTHGRS